MQIEVMKDPRVTANELKKKHPELLEGVSERTIQHRLQKELELPSQKPAVKPLLTKQMTKKRQDFARKYKHWTKEDWHKVLWSDESKFLCVRKRPGMIRRPKNSDRYSPRYTEKSVKHSDGVMVWGSFSGVGGWGSLYVLPKGERMTQHKYTQVLEDHMLPVMESHGCESFMQDGAPCHTAKSVKK